MSIASVEINQLLSVPHICVEGFEEFAEYLIVVAG